MLGRFLSVLLLAGAAWPAAAAPISLEEAVRRLAAAPDLRAAEAGRRAAEAGLRDADRPPNPTAEIELENFAGTRPYRGIEGVEVTALIEQPIERGGKRGARVALARADLALAVAEAGSEARRLTAELIRTYAEGAAGRARAALAAEQVEVAETLAGQSARRLAVGDIAEVEHDRVLVTLGEARAELERALRDAEAAERALGLLVGAEGAVEADPAFLTAAQSPDPATVRLLLADEDRWAAVADRARAQVGAARAERVPDLTARGGVRALRDEGAVALVAGVSLPLPLFNSGRARVAQAQAEAEQAGLTAEAQRRETQREAERALADWRTARRLLESIERHTLPAAERLASLSERGYRLGALPYRDLADARLSLFAARRARFDALEQIARARADLAQRTGAFRELGFPL